MEGCADHISRLKTFTETATFAFPAHFVVIGMSGVSASFYRRSVRSWVYLIYRRISYQTFRNLQDRRTCSVKFCSGPVNFEKI